MMHKEEEKSRMVCPFRVHGVTTPSATIPDAIFRNEYFMPCLHDDCNSAIVADPNCKGQAYKIFPVKIRAGYNSKVPAAVLRVHCIFGKGGVREWGADPDKYYYILQILHIESIENWKGGNV